MPSLYEYLNQQTNALPNYTDITGTPSLAGFIDRYKPSNVNTSLIADSLGNNSISLPNASSTLSYKAPTFTQSLGNFINRFNPMSSSPSTPAISDGLKDTNWGNTPFSSKLGFGLAAVSSALDAIGAHRAYSLGKRQLTAQTDQFNRQFAAQRGLVNSQLADRQDWRNRNMPNQYLSTAEYMDKYGVK